MFLSCTMMGSEAAVSVDEEVVAVVVGSCTAGFSVPVACDGKRYPTSVMMEANYGMVVEKREGMHLVKNEVCAGFSRHPIVCHCGSRSGIPGRMRAHVCRGAQPLHGLPSFAHIGAAPRRHALRFVLPHPHVKTHHSARIRIIAGTGRAAKCLRTAANFEFGGIF